MEKTMKRHIERRFLLLLVLLFCAMALVKTHVASCSVSLADNPPKGPSARILVVYYSRTGNTEKMAHAVIEGAKRVPGVVTKLRKASEASKEDLDLADGIILGCPTYFANLPGEVKTIMDTWNWKMKVDFTDKVGGAFTTAGGQVGGQGNVVVSLLLFMLNNRMIVAGPLYHNEVSGSIWGESGAAAITGPLDPGVSDKELDGTRRLGERIARVTKKIKGHVI
jgi:NAD(P)H dehydrogenase (quinone)